MTVSWRIEKGIAWIQSEGPWSSEDWKAALQALLAHPDFRPGMGLIHDRRRILIPLGGTAAHEVRAAIAFIRARSARIGKARWALVVADPVNYGMGRMAQALIQETEITLGNFYDLAEAEAWVRAGAEG